MAFLKIKKILADQLGVEESKITEQSRIVEDLGADSLDVVELLMFLEDEFGIEVSEEDAVNLSTVQDIINIVNAID